MNGKFYLVSGSYNSTTEDFGQEKKNVLFYS